MRRARALLSLALAGGLGALTFAAACELVDPASTLDRRYGSDAGPIEDGASGGGARCYVDVIDDQPLFAYCPSDEACCFGGGYLAPGACRSSVCANLEFKCSDRSQCGPSQVCCSPTGLMGDYLVLQGSSCADTCTGNGDIVLCDLARSPACPAGTTCQTNGPGNRPLSYDSCKP